MTKKQIVEEFLGKFKQRYPRCATTIFEVNGDGFASVSLAVEGAHVIVLDIDWDDPKIHGYDSAHIFDKNTSEVLWNKDANHLKDILVEAEKAFVAFVEHEKGHAMFTSLLRHCSSKR